MGLRNVANGEFTKTGMTVFIDTDKCEPCGFCSTMVPEVFVEDRTGKGHVNVEGNIPPEERKGLAAVGEVPDELEEYVLDVVRHLCDPHCIHVEVVTAVQLPTGRTLVRG